MKYSIILPVRNGGEYVRECVTSILVQELNDFNLHVLDNNSTDGTFSWIESLNDKRIILYPSSQSLSIEENWGRIKSIPKNEFVTLIGHDDVLEKDYLSVMDKLITKHPNASLYQTHFHYINAKGEVIRKCKPMDEIQNGSEFLSLFLCNTIDSNGTGFMMRSKDYDELGGIPLYPNLLFADFELWINLTMKSYKATAYNECFSFRIHQSTTSTSADLKMQNAFDKFIDYLENLKKKDSSLKVAIERYSIDFIKLYCKGLAHRLMRTAKSKRNNQSVDSLLKQCKNYADRLAPGNKFNPYDNFSVKLASYLDSNFITREMFLTFKKLYSKPILN
jgi:glycosyltransferase involved in cell wall biosynthesis